MALASGAREKTRTSTTVKSLVPETSASTIPPPGQVSAGDKRVAAAVSTSDRVGAKTGEGARLGSLVSGWRWPYLRSERRWQESVHDRPDRHDLRRVRLSRAADCSAHGSRRVGACASRSGGRTRPISCGPTVSSGRSSRSRPTSATMRRLGLPSPGPTRSSIVSAFLPKPGEQTFDALLDEGGRPYRPALRRGRCFAACAHLRASAPIRQAIASMLRPRGVARPPCAPPSRGQ